MMAHSVGGGCITLWVVLMASSLNAESMQSAVPEGPAPRILILNSYHRGFRWTDEIERGAEEVLQARWPGVEIYNEYLDAKRFGDEALFAQALATFRRKYPDGALDLILVSDDDAYQFILAARHQWQVGTPVVFCGVNGFAEEQLRGHESITGVVQDVGFRESIELGVSLQEDARQVAIITGNTRSGRLYREGFAACFPNAWQVEPVWLDGTQLTDEQLLARLGALPPEAFVIMAFWWRDAAGEYRVPEEIMEECAAACRAPIYSLLPSDVDHGAVGGYIQDGTIQGRTAAEMAVRILDGTPAGDIPIRVEGTSRYLFHRAGLERFGIPEESLPSGSTIIKEDEIRLTPEERQWIGRQGPIRVLVAERPPLEVRSAPPSGVSVDFLSRIAERTGLDFEFDTRSRSRAEVLARLRSGEGDLVLTLTPTDARERDLTFTRPYLDLQWVLFTRIGGAPLSSMGDLDGKTVAVEEGYLVHEMLRSRYPSLRLLLTEGPAEALHAVAAGRADGYIGDLAVGAYVVRSEGLSNVAVAAPAPFAEHGLAMAVRRDVPHLAGILDKAIAATDPMVLKRLQTKYQEGVPYEYGFTPQQVMQYALVGVSIFALVISATLALAVANIRRRRRVERTLRESDERMRLAIDAAHFGTWDWYPQTGEAKADSKWRRLFQLEGDDQGRFTLDFWSEMIHPEDASGVLLRLRQVLDGSCDALNEEYRQRHPEKGWIWTAVAGSVITRDARGKATRLVGVQMDIDQRKRAEIVLAESRAALEEAQAIARVGSWTYNVRNDAFTSSREARRILYNDPDATETNLETHLQRVLDDDAPAVRQAFTTTIETHAPLDIEFRLPLDRALRYVHVRADFVAQADGSTYLVGSIQDVTDRKRTELALRESEMRLEEAQAIAHIGHWRIDLRDDALEWSAELKRIWGYDPEKFGGSFDDFIAGVHPDDRDRFNQDFWDFVNKGAPLSATWRIRSRDGRTKHVHARGARVEREGDTPVAAFGTLQDVTEHVLAREELRRREDYLRITLNSIGDAVIATDAKGRIERINPIASRLCGWPQDDAVGRSLTDVFRIVNAFSRETVEDPVDRVLATGEIVGLANHTVLISRAGEEFQIADSAAPIRNEAGDVLGVVLVFRDVTLAYENERLLQESEERYRRTLEIVREGVWDWNLQTGRVIRSDRCFTMLGYDPGEVSSPIARWIARIHDDDRDRVDAALNRAIEQDERFEIEFRMRHKDGSWRWILSRGEVVERDAQGDAVRMLGARTDITERKRAEEAIHEREEDLRITLHSIGDAVIATDDRGNVTRLNTVAEELTGWPQAEAVGRPLAEVFHIVNSITRKVVENPVAKVLEHGVVVGLANHTLLIARDGAEYQIADSAAPIRDATGQMRGVVLVFRDVTEDYLRDQLLRESEERHRMVLEAVRDGVWDWNVAEDHAVCSDRWFEILGYRPQEFVVSGRDFADRLLHPDDSEAWDAIRECAESGELYEVEIRMRTASGDYRWVQSRGRVVKRDANGRALRMMGTTTDIHDKKQSQLLAERQVEIHRALFRGMVEACVYFEPILNEEGRLASYRFLDVNPAFERITGVQRADALGREISEVWSVDEDAWFEHAARVIATGQPEQFEMYHAATGRHYVSSVFQPETERKSFCISFFDITSRIRAEKALGEANEQLKQHSESLERTVAERTAEIVEKNHSLQQTLDELRSTQSQLVQSEKMAVLGHLIAGVAHEINTPLGAINSAGGMVDLLFDKFMGRIYAFVDWTRSEIGPLIAALLDAAPKSGEILLSSRERRTLRDRLTEELDAYGVARSREVASLLIDLDLTEHYQSYIPLFHHDESVHILETIRDISGIHRGASIIQMATQKAAKIVFALKSYAHRNPMGRMEYVDIARSIDTVLMLYHSKIKHEIELVCEFDEIPHVPCHPDEISQIWTNLIHNALQAMDYRGRLFIRLARDEDDAIVSISDSGCGITDSIRDRIFEPFFTTKAAGEGSGLGLDIVRNIVQRHHGSIDFESTEGQGATFTVRLPFQQPDA